MHILKRVVITITLLIIVCSNFSPLRWVFLLHSFPFWPYMEIIFAKLELFAVCAGHTGDFSEMLSHILEKHPHTLIVCIGFSLGGNLVTKYMGETDRCRSPNIIGGLSVCQGYCAIE
jgi:hypothetical protein